MLLPAMLQWTHATGAWVNTPCVKANRASGMVCQGRLSREGVVVRCSAAHVYICTATVGHMCVQVMTAWMADQCCVLRAAWEPMSVKQGHRLRSLRGLTLCPACSHAGVSGHGASHATRYVTHACHASQPLHPP